MQTMELDQDLSKIMTPERANMSVSKGDITELKNLATPNPAVVEVLKCCEILMGG